MRSNRATQTPRGRRIACLVGFSDVKLPIDLIAFQQVVAAFAADTSFDQAVALGATLRSQGNFSLRAGADDHFDSFLEQFRLRAGSNERGKLAEEAINLKRLATTLIRWSN